MKRNTCALLAGVLVLLFYWVTFPAAPAEVADPDIPRVHDDRLQVALFAADPDIVHPIGIDFDQRGRLLVIESHTHFPPADYQGPKHDRIRILEDTTGDGKADRFTTFFEGTRATMDIAVHPDGSVYLATRNEVLRLRDTNGDGKADSSERLVFLDTKGNYPHNGLSGLCFDSRGDLFFGMGENLGVPYKLIGADGVTLEGEGEGGNVFWCTAGGKQLRRVATGFWNPFGVCRDIFGRLFVVDNDPDGMPPCRMLHLVEGGDYGYQFRYGRAGRHPFQAWNGQLPGTLPMMSDTGEAPCEVLSYESDGLPHEYLGNLLVTSWADHRVERYVVREQGSSFTAERKPFVQGGQDFRPVGLVVAPDGSLFVSDWVLRNYTLHGKGAIWHIKPKQGRQLNRGVDTPRSPDSLRQALASAHRPLRELSARRLAADESGRDFLRRQIKSDDVRIRAASLTALIDADDRKIDLHGIADTEREVGLRALAVRTLANRGEDVRRFLDARQPAELRREAVACLTSLEDASRLLDLLGDADPFLRQAAIQQLANNPKILTPISSGRAGRVNAPVERIGLLLAHRASGHSEASRLLSRFLTDPDDEVRFLAAKWIADEKLQEYRPALIEALKDQRLNVRLFAAYSTALARIEGREVNESRLADYFLTRLTDEHSPSAVRVLALQMLPANHSRLTVELLGKLLANDDVLLQRETVRILGEHRTPQREAMLLQAVRNPRLQADVRAHALIGLAEKSSELRDELLRLARSEPPLGDEALRSLLHTSLTDSQRKELEELARQRPASADLVARILGNPFCSDRPPTQDLDAWSKRLEGPADADVGRRIFFHSKLGGCYRCHRVEGRGQEIGPDLSTVGYNERRRILESLLQPSATVAPHYQVWQLETSDGKVLSGMLVRTQLDEYTYVDAQGSLFKLNTRHIVESRPLPTSIMPDGLVNLLTDQELRDLLAYLCSCR